MRPYLLGHLLAFLEIESSHTPEESLLLLNQESKNQFPVGSAVTETNFRSQIPENAVPQSDQICEQQPEAQEDANNVAGPSNVNQLESGQNDTNEAQNPNPITEDLLNDNKEILHTKLNIIETRSQARSRKAMTSTYSISSIDSKKIVFESDKTSPYLVEAPIFQPSAKEFMNQAAYLRKIMPEASKFGLCKVIAPPSFKPSCVINEEIRFEVVNQYITRLFNRWGPASRKMSAIKAHLALQSVKFMRAPLLDGVEINLPKLYHLVQRHGGLTKVIKNKRWARIAEQMGFPKSPKTARKIDQMYLKYVMPYGMLLARERNDILQNVDKAWYKKNEKLLKRALNPLYRKKRLLGESESSEDDTDTEDERHIGEALTEAEDCIVAGRTMSLAVFKKVCATTFTFVI